MTETGGNELPDGHEQLRHDLMAHLAVIVGYAELISRRNDEATRQEGSARILEAAELLKQKVNLLFDRTSDALSQPPPDAA